MSSMDARARTVATRSDASCANSPSRRYRTIRLPDATAVPADRCGAPSRPYNPLRNAIEGMKKYSPPFIVTV